MDGTFGDAVIRRRVYGGDEGVASGNTRGPSRTVSTSAMVSLVVRWVGAVMPLLTSTS